MSSNVDVEANGGTEETAPLTTDGDDPKVAIVTPGRSMENKEAKLEVEQYLKKSSAKTTTDEFAPLTKAELMQYAEDPFWSRLRWLLFVLFWVVWFAMLFGAVAIIVLTPKCYSPPPKRWWQKASVYQVDVRSFKDADNDGIGDLKGMTMKVDYLASLGVGSVILSPIFDSRAETSSDFGKIDRDLGSLEDFKTLLNGLKEKDIKLLLDFNLEFTSDQHEWFSKSAQNDEDFKDFYVWRQGTQGTPPNAWKSETGESAWAWNDARGAFYLHRFGSQQPQLNYGSKKLLSEMEKQLNFWLDLGVSGFRFTPGLLTFDDETAAKLSDLRESKKTLEVLRQLRGKVDAATGEDEDNERVILLQSEVEVDELSKFYGDKFGPHSGDIVHVPINNVLVNAFEEPDEVNADKVKKVVMEYLSSLPPSAWPSFSLGHRDTRRAASRFGHGLVDGMNMILMLLPGTPITYYGEEIGLLDGSDVDLGPGRNPMQWTSSAQAGFTSGTPWTALNNDFEVINVASQKDAGQSHLKVYQQLAEMRHKASILFGESDFYAGDNVFAFVRVRKGNPGYLVIVNFGDVTVLADVSSLRFLPDGGGSVHLQSYHNDPIDHIKEGVLQQSSRVDFTQVPLRPKEGVVVTFVPKMD